MPQNYQRQTLTALPAHLHQEARPVSPHHQPHSTQHHAWMRSALDLAPTALATGDVPIAALVIHDDGAVVGRGVNRREADGDPTAHAELLALREAAHTLGRWRLEHCTLVVTLEPCAMCAGASVLARIPRVVLGAWDPKAGACGSVMDVVRNPALNHWTQVHGDVLAEECGELIREFFRGHRDR
ncbi:MULTISPECIES: tRNA adenosine(34) deaminase TadA [Kocuria]|uniref:tRNA-specific adenosine deaminase n=1 Tax=Kocuria subflava TaxID=1736139 RepID=A0A846U1A1_9MICC|nr:MULTISPECIES: tRNA adenosine(34) deaminase TadA [Kocuria]NKE08501.1 nucleoside deaminase [Kocuria subflava]